MYGKTPRFIALGLVTSSFLVAGWSGCERERSRPADPSEVLEEPPGARDAYASPIVDVDRPPITQGEGERGASSGSNIGDCTTVVVEPGRRSEYHLPLLEARVSNSCAFPVAVLTGPMEVMSGDEIRRQPWFGRTDVFARFVILEEGETLTRDQAGPVRDGEAKVFGHPRYYVVVNGSEARIPLVGIKETLQGLGPGRYCAVLLTYGAPAEGARVSKEPFDLTLTIDRHNEQGSAKRVVLAPDARMLRSKCKNFTVP